MKSLDLTGHYILDSGLAAAAALLEDYDQRSVSSPQELSGEDILRALDLAETHFFYQSVSKTIEDDQRPLFYFLLQEILPGSPWDQVKTGDVPGGMRRKFEEYIGEVKKALSEASPAPCFLSGKAGHLSVSKSHLPMLSSAGERPNCYPNLSDGLMLNGYLAIAVLLAPFNIEKTLNAKGKGGQNLVYHATDWLFMVEVARQNIDRIRRLCAAGSLESFRTGYYPTFRRGSWRKALQTLMHAADKIPAEARPQVVIWSFNASNQNCRYQCNETSDAFLIIAAQRRRQPALYRELLRVSDEVAQLILRSGSIIKASQIRNKTSLEMCPEWPFQRFYAEMVLAMSPTLFDSIEDAATFLNADKAAINYCLHDVTRPDVRVLAERYKLPPETVARLASAPFQWPDYLRAALIWADKGNSFGPRPSTEIKPEEIELVLREVAPRIAKIGSYKLAARLLNTYNPRVYRQAWIRLLSRKAATWEDFLYFNPVDEAFGSGEYARTSTLRHYLVAYLLACVHQQPQSEVPQEDEIEREIQQLENEIPIADEDQEENEQ